MRLRKLILAMLLLLTASAARAQYKYVRPELGVGVNGGVVLLSQVGFSPSVEQAFTLGFTGGITVRYIMQKHFGVQIELNYTRRGWSERSELTGELYTHALDYIEIPFVSHIFFGSDKVRFFVNLGPKIRYMVYDKASAPFSQSAGVQQGKAIENRFDYSIFGGLGLELRSKKAGIFQLEARYDFGLGNIFSSRKGEDFAGSNNTGITVGLVYMFDVFRDKDWSY